MPTIVRLGNKDWATTAAEVVVKTINEVLRNGKRCRFALAGGSTPRALYQTLAANFKDAIPWSRVDFFWGDERCVPPDDPASNYRMAKETLLTPLQIADARRHRIKGELPSNESARAYNEKLETPVDVVLLGMGTDGHTASIFPDTAQRTTTTLNAVPTRSPAPPYDRVTMTLNAFKQARAVLFLVTGSAKANRVAEVLRQRKKPTSDDLPAAQVDARETLLWMLDDEAAAHIQPSQ